MARTGRPKAPLILTPTSGRQLVRWSRRAKSAQALALRSPHRAGVRRWCRTNKQVAARSARARGDGRQVAGAGLSPDRLDGLVDEPRPGGRPRSPWSRSRRWWSPRWRRRRQERHALVAGVRWPSGRAVASRRSDGSGGPSSLKPHRADSFKLSTDPLFVEKVYDVVGLYLNPPERAVVLCVDEKSQIQALARSQPVLPMMPGMPERRTHDYARHGITSLFAAFNIADGTVISALHRRHRAAEFKKFLTKIDAEVPADAGRPRDLRQLRHPQDPGDQHLAREAPPLPPALHPDQLQSWINQVERLVRLPHRPSCIRRGGHAQRPSPRRPTSAPGSMRGTSDPKPFVWTKTAEQILQSLGRLLTNESQAQDTSFSQTCCHSCSGNIAGTSGRSISVPLYSRFPTRRAERRMYVSLSFRQKVTPVVVLMPLLVQSLQMAWMESPATTRSAASRINWTSCGTRLHQSGVWPKGRLDPG